MNDSEDATDDGRGTHGDDPPAPDRRGTGAPDGAKTGAPDDHGDRRTTVVVGVGDGLGSSLARRFAVEGDRVGLIARSRKRLERVGADLRAETPGDAVAAPADVADPAEVSAAFGTVRSAFGPVDAMLWSVYSTRTDRGGLLDVDLEDFEGAWRVETAGAFLCAREAVRDMVEDGGTVVFTNSAAGKRGAPRGLTRSSSRAGLRGLAESMARDPDLSAVHVAHVVVDGWLDTPALREAHPEHPEDARMDPDRVADTYLHLVEQSDDARSFEVDLRSSRDDLLRAWNGGKGG